MKKLLCLLTLLVIPISVDSVYSQTRDEKVINDRENIQGDTGWFYDDLERGIEAAHKANKPLMVVLRCIP